MSGYLYSSVTIVNYHFIIKVITINYYLYWGKSVLLHGQEVNMLSSDCMCFISTATRTRLMLDIYGLLANNKQ